MRRAIPLPMRPKPMKPTFIRKIRLPGGTIRGQTPQSPRCLSPNWLKICGRERVIAVPVDDLAVLVFQEWQKTAVRSTLEAMAWCLDGDGGLDGLGRRVRSCGADAAGCLHGDDSRCGAGSSGFERG